MTIAERDVTHETAQQAGTLGAATTGIGGALTTVVATACCASPVLAPMIVGLVGASGAAWAAGLKPYRGYMLLGSFVMIAGSLWSVYRPRPACSLPAAGFRDKWLPRITKGVVWCAALLWATALVVDLNVS